MGIIDAHVHLQLSGWPSMIDGSHRPDQYATLIEDLSVEAYAVLVMAPRGDLDRCRAMNDAALAVATEDRRAFPLCSVHPADGAEALAEVDRVAAAGASGLKLHPNTQQFDVADDGVLEVVRRAGEHGMAVLFDSVALADPGQPEKFVQLSVAAPDTRIVLAHAFGPKFAQAVMFGVLARYPWAKRNVYLELSALAPMFAGSPFVEQISWLCRSHGLDRVLWGSDFPIYEPGEALSALDTYGFTPSERDQITAATAREVYRLG